MDAFDQDASIYDRSRRQLIPCYDEFYGTIPKLLLFEPSSAPAIADLGAGTGLVTALLAERFPRAHLTLVYDSAPMLDIARRRLASIASRCTFLVQDYTTGLLTASYDAMVSALSIHHLPDAAKRALFAAIYGALRPGGIFVNADQACGDQPGLEARYQSQWLNEARASGIAPEDLAASLERRKQDRMATLADQLAWLREAGFADVNCWYKNFSFVVYSGAKRG
jgi:tRNA (cmo5U34)-methyltransferase